MGVPSTRTPVRIARGTYANLTTVNALAALEEGEICYATDLERLYVKQGGTIKAVSATTNAAPAPGDVTASPAFVSGTGTQSDPYIITNGAVAFSGGTLESTQEITLDATAGDIVVLTDNSGSGSGTRFANQDVGIVNSAGKFTFKLKYIDSPGTTTNNTTYTGDLQIGTTYFSWVVVQSNLTNLSESSATTISFDSLAVGGTGTAVPGALTGGTSPYSYTTRWQRSFTGTGGWFDTGITGTSYTVVSADSGYYVRAVTTGTDSTPGGQGGPLTLELPSASSGQININSVATVNSLTLSANNINSNRFTSETFDVTAVMAPEGVPTTTKSLKVEFGGSLNAYPQTDNVSSTTSGDPIGTNVNQTSLDGIKNAGGTSGTAYYNWHAPLFYSGTGGTGFINTAMYHQSGYSMQFYWTDSYGISNDEPYAGAALQNQLPSYGGWYTNTSLNTYMQWYQNSGGGNSGQSVYSISMYKPDCVLIYGSLGGWMFIDNFSMAKNDSTLSRWKPIAHNNLTSSSYKIAYVDAGGEKYAVLGADNVIYVMEGDLTDYNNCTSTTVNTGALIPNSSYTNASWDGAFSHGTKVTIRYRYYYSSSYYVYRFYTCDFSVNDGTNISHWDFKQEFNTGSSTGPYFGGTAVNPDNTNQIWVTFGQSDMFVYSTNGGESYSTRSHPSPQGWLRSGNIAGMAFHRGKLLTCMKAFASWNGGSTSNYTNRFWVLAQSSDGGNNWTGAQYDPQAANDSSSNVYSNQNPTDVIDKTDLKPIFINGGWIFVAGQAAYQGSYYYYRTGLYIKDQDTVNLAGTTNLTNNYIREGDKVIQPGTSPTISAFILDISGSQLKCAGFNNANQFENGKPLQNTISYFGGSTSKLYGVMDSGGNVTDLVANDPGSVNVGYGVSNTITMPATFPSGNSPDFELPAGTTIKATVTFANTSGIVTATSNTLTPS